MPQHDVGGTRGPGSRKTESFLGGMARPRSYREATPIACDIVGADSAISALP